MHAKVITVLGLIPTSSGIVEFERRREAVLIKVLKNKNNPPSEKTELN